MPRQRQQTPDFIFDQVELVGDCLFFTGYCDRSGYGKTWYNGRGFYAHRLAYIIKKGPIPGRLYVLHKCDNPGCINPDHLFLGTQRDNIVDMYKKGRGKKAAIAKAKP